MLEISMKLIDKKMCLHNLIYFIIKFHEFLRLPTFVKKHSWQFHFKHLHIKINFFHLKNNFKSIKTQQKPKKLFITILINYSKNNSFQIASKENSQKILAIKYSRFHYENLFFRKNLLFLLLKAPRKIMLCIKKKKKQEERRK